MYKRQALNALKDEGFDVISVGKINDIFCGEGITKAYHSESSVHGMQQTVDAVSYTHLDVYKRQAKCIAE